MGFETKEAKGALKQARNDLDMALDILHGGSIGGSSNFTKYELEPTENRVVKLMLYISQ